jgi:hypothetical protein
LVALTLDDRRPVDRFLAAGNGHKSNFCPLLR